MHIDLSPLQVVTRRLPAIISEPLTALIGKECYTALVWNTDLSNQACLKLALSKVLGLGLVVGGGIVKLPQIIKIVSARSARGLSLSSYVLDTASLLIYVAYNMRNHFPFSTYGENVFLAIQNVVIISLIVFFSSRNNLLAPVFLAAITATSYLLLSDFVTTDALQLLLTASMPISLASKIPQILTNYQQKSTGQLAAFTVFNSFAGCAARVYTTATETGDATLWWSFVLATALNGVLALQMLAYWNKDAKAEPVKEKVAEKVEKLEEKPASTPNRSSPRKKASTTPGRQGQWTRKVD